MDKKSDYFNIYEDKNGISIDDKYYKENIMTSNNGTKKMDVSLSKTTESEISVIGDIISYNIKVKNNSNTLIKNIEIIDNGNKNLYILDGKVYYNRVLIDKNELKKGIYRDTLESGEEFNINFDAKVIGCGDNNEIFNYVDFYYEYTEKNKEISLHDRIESMHVKVRNSSSSIEKQSDKEFIVNADNPPLNSFYVENKIDIRKLNLKNIVQINDEFEIENFYTIKSIHSEIDDNKLLSKNELMVIAKIKKLINYSENSINAQVSTIKNEFSFIESIVLAENYRAGMPINVIGTSKNIDLKIKDGFIYLKTLVVIEAMTE